MIVLFLGIMLTQIINVLIRWQQYKTREYFYYLVYLSVFFIYLIILFSDTLLPQQYHYENWQVNFVSRPVGLLIYFFYNEFVVNFLTLPKANPSLNRVMKWYSRFLFLTLFNQLLMQYIFRNRVEVLDDLHSIFSLSIFFVVIYFLYRFWKMRTKLTAYVLKGSLSLTIGTFITNIINVLMLQGKLKYGEYYFYPVLIGIALEIYFFNNGLFYKTRSAERQLINTQKLLIDEMQENEKLLVDRQSMRNKIARDLHDDVGATLSGIALHSHLSTINMEKHDENAVKKSLVLMQSSASEMVNKLNDIVWAVNPVHDELEKIIQRLEEYAVTMAAAKNIEVHVEKDADVIKKKLPMEIRKNIYLVCKEAINNAVKYSSASNLTISVTEENDECKLSIKDDGCGFENTAVKKGNGLQNMLQRVQEINARLSVDTKPLSGTIVTVSCKIPH
jgi:signal transduction histidine kinase